MKTTTLLGSAIVLAVAIWVGGCGIETEAEDEAVETRQSEIYKGVVLNATEVADRGLVAIYHPKLPSGYFKRPCSGVILKSGSTPGGIQSVVMTARHCVTADGSTWGALAHPSLVRLIATPAPGIANPNIPAGTVAANSIVGNFGFDIALITVLNDWSSIANRRLGLYVGSPQHLVGRQLSAFGYGIDSSDGSCVGNSNVVTGAGTARMGSPFQIVEASVDPFSNQPIMYKYTNSNAQGQRVMCGDSGGPDQMDMWGDWRYILGIHSTGVDVKAESVAISANIQIAIGGLYLSVRKIGSASAPEIKNIGVGGQGELVMGFPGYSVVYDRTTQRLHMSYGCLSVRTNAQGQSEPYFASTCDNSNLQKWNFDPATDIRNLQTNQCITAVSATSVLMTSCNVYDQRQRWLFHPQP